MRVAVDAEKADRRGNRRLVLARRAPLHFRQQGQLRLVANLPDRQHRIVLQRSIETGDFRDGRERVDRLLVAERFDHDAASWGQAMDAYGVDSALLAYAGVNRRVAWWDPARWALVFRAVTQVGSATTRMRTNVDSLEAQAGGAGIFISRSML